MFKFINKNSHFFIIGIILIILIIAITSIVHKNKNKKIFADLKTKLDEKTQFEKLFKEMEVKLNVIPEVIKIPVQKVSSEVINEPLETENKLATNTN